MSRTVSVVSPVLVAVVAVLFTSISTPSRAQPQGVEEQDKPAAAASEDTPKDDSTPADRGAGRPGFGRRGRGPGGPGFGGPRQQERKLLAKFDVDRSGWLNAEERAAARQEIAAEPQRFGPGGPGGPGPGGPGRRGGRGPRFGRRENQEPPKPGERVSPGDVANYPDADLYDPAVLRTLFLELENADWEKELSDFYNSDVEVPAKLTVDGKEYPQVGLHFRGMSSYMGVGAGHKRSLNLSLDFVNSDQRLYGYRTLNLLNSHDDESMMSAALYSHIARKILPAPKANFVRVVINGEDWGVYANVQQFNKDFVQKEFGTGKGTRWKIRGNPGGDGGLRYLGEEIEPYRQRFTMKSQDNEQAWRDLIKLCRTLEQTPPEELQTALEPQLDIDGTLKFLALDVALVNMDGYWVRASDYNLYQDPTGRFHLIPSDMNEAFRGGGGPRGGPGMRGPRRGGRRQVDPRAERDEGAPDRRSTEDVSDARPGRPDRSESEPADEDARQRPADQSAAEPDGEGAEFGPSPGDPGFGPPEFGPPEFGPPEFGPPPEIGPPGPGDGPPGFGPSEFGPPPEFGPPAPGDGPPGFGPPGFGPPGFGPPGFGGPGGGGPTLDPLVGRENERTPLRSKLLAVPALRDRYLEYVHAIAKDGLDWNNLGPVVAAYRELIRDAVQRDTRKLSSLDDFDRATADEPEQQSNGRSISLRSFADKRREYLLNWKDDAGKEAAESPRPGEVTPADSAGAKAE